MAQSYQVGSMFLPGLKTNERYSSGNLGKILIGGDRGDVKAASAINETQDDQSGIMLEDAEFITTLDLDDCSQEQIEFEITEVVLACYDSIQEETFVQSKKVE